MGMNVDKVHEHEHDHDHDHDHEHEYEHEHEHEHKCEHEHEHVQVHLYLHEHRHGHGHMGKDRENSMSMSTVTRDTAPVLHTAYFTSFSLILLTFALHHIHVAMSTSNYICLASICFISYLFRTQNILMRLDVNEAISD